MDSGTAQGPRGAGLASKTGKYVTWQEADDYMAASFFMLGDTSNVQRSRALRHRRTRRKESSPCRMEGVERGDS